MLGASSHRQGEERGSFNTTANGTSRHRTFLAATTPAGPLRETRSWRLGRALWGDRQCKRAVPLDMRILGEK